MLVESYQNLIETSLLKTNDEVNSLIKEYISSKLLYLNQNKIPFELQSILQESCVKMEDILKEEDKDKKLESAILLYDVLDEIENTTVQLTEGVKEYHLSPDFMVNLLNDNTADLYDKRKHSIVANLTIDEINKLKDVKF